MREEVFDSYPPSCVDGTPVDGWDWDAFAHEEQDGVRWGDYSLIVTPDGDHVHVSLAATLVDDGS